MVRRRKFVARRRRGAADCGIGARRGGLAVRVGGGRSDGRRRCRFTDDSVHAGHGARRPPGARTMQSRLRGRPLAGKRRRAGPRRAARRRRASAGAGRGGRRDCGAERQSASGRLARSSAVAGARCGAARGQLCGSLFRRRRGAFVGPRRLGKFTSQFTRRRRKFTSRRFFRRYFAAAPVRGARRRRRDAARRRAAGSGGCGHHMARRENRRRQRRRRRRRRRDVRLAEVHLLPPRGAGADGGPNRGYAEIPPRVPADECLWRRGRIAQAVRGVLQLRRLQAIWGGHGRHTEFRSLPLRKPFQLLVLWRSRCAARGIKKRPRGRAPRDAGPCGCDAGRGGRRRRLRHSETLYVLRLFVDAQRPRQAAPGRPRHSGRRRTRIANEAIRRLRRRDEKARRRRIARGRAARVAARCNEAGARAAAAALPAGRSRTRGLGPGQARRARDAAVAGRDALRPGARRERRRAGVPGCLGRR
mmetsp:Transcript_4703/g.16555  ORF Transcript_4703/g.16555 Transcript_4703/m.16555 type:complete len:474 (-) Transcript_4703:1195-2616(-)